MAQQIYHEGGGSTEQINEVLQQIWQDYETDPQLRERVAATGADLATLDAVPNKAQMVEVEPKAGGLGPIAIAIIVKFVIPVAAKVAIDLWNRVLLPEIEKKLGGGAIGARVDGNGRPIDPNTPPEESQDSNS